MQGRKSQQASLKITQFQIVPRPDGFNFLYALDEHGCMHRRVIDSKRDGWERVHSPRLEDEV
ncbi:MAG: hypothetical protein NPIRA02_10800 [Nitrospirales bacterium]|nr:MAG: hypothetical protein NPIRA02_10800 [Nitrospirales bacterium]